MRMKKKNRKKEKNAQRGNKKRQKKTCPTHYHIQTEAISAVIYKNARRLEGLDMHNYLYQ